MFDQKEYNRQWSRAHREQCREAQQRRRGGQSMSENRACPQFLGVHVAERMLAHLFKDVVRMPHGTPGYDFKCANGYLVDVKSACKRMSPSGTGKWTFHINRNVITDFFLCIAYDNRNDLNPLHLWLIPEDVLSCFVGTSISETTLDKWIEYEKSIDGAILCCNAMKGMV